MNVLSLTTVFPNKAQPTHGVFVFERLRHLARKTSVRVIAPVMWRTRVKNAIPAHAEIGGLPVDYPTWWYLPGLLKVVDGVFLFLSILPAVLRARRSRDFDVIDAHFAFPEGFAAALLSMWFHRPFTVTMRGTEIPLSRYALRRAAIAWVLRRADRVIAVAEPLARFAVSLGVPAERVVVVENGVDAEMFRPGSRTEARQALGITLDGPIIVSVGHLSARKGFQRVLRVMPKLLPIHASVRFVIVGGPGGEPNNKPALDALVRALGLEEHVVFAGPQPPTRVAEWLNAADVFVLASDYEGCPNVVLEALACGKPVVATRVGHVDKMVPDYAGILVDSADDETALSRALDQALTTKWDGGRIRAHAERQSWSDVAARVLEQWQLADGVVADETRRPHSVEMRTP